LVLYRQLLSTAIMPTASLCPRAGAQHRRRTQNAQALQTTPKPMSANYTLILTDHENSKYLTSTEVLSRRRAVRSTRSFRHPDHLRPRPANVRANALTRRPRDRAVEETLAHREQAVLPLTLSKEVSATMAIHVMEGAEAEGTTTLRKTTVTGYGCANEIRSL
jgi:hypothetical protein